MIGIVVIIGVCAMGMSLCYAIKGIVFTNFMNRQKRKWDSLREKEWN